MRFVKRSVRVIGELSRIPVYPLARRTRVKSHAVSFSGQDNILVGMPISTPILSDGILLYQRYNVYRRKKTSAVSHMHPLSQQAYDLESYSFRSQNVKHLSTNFYYAHDKAPQFPHATKCDDASFKIGFRRLNENDRGNSRFRSTRECQF